MKVVYLAHPVTPLPGETIEQNLQGAMDIFKQLSIAHPDRCFVMPWLDHVRAFAGDKDDSSGLRALGMRRNEAVIERCDEICLVGPRMSRGMRDELDYAKAIGLTIYEWIAGEMPAGMKE